MSEKKRSQEGAELPPEAATSEKSGRRINLEYESVGGRASATSTDPSSLLSRFFRWFGRLFEGSMKWAIRLALAVGLIAVPIAIIAYLGAERQQREAAELAQPKVWLPQGLVGYTNFVCNLTTRCASASWPITMEYRLTINGLPENLAKLRMQLQNYAKSFGTIDNYIPEAKAESSPLVLTFLDKDGFIKLKVGLTVADVHRIVDGSEIPVALTAQGTLEIGRNVYKLELGRDIYRSLVNWYLTTRLQEDGN